FSICSRQAAVVHINKYGDWFLDTEGMKVVKDSIRQCPLLIITGDLRERAPRKRQTLLTKNNQSSEVP
ncbi:hypothetical protein DPI70_24585, partial [Escherichia coli]|nr:hypothetical protein [Escherichia coli]